jgi:hypothetical protein
VHHPLHDQGRGHAQDARQRGQLLVLQALVGGQVGGDDPDQVVGVAEEALSVNDLRDGCEPRLEAQQGPGKVV